MRTTPHARRHASHGCPQGVADRADTPGARAVAAFPRTAARRAPVVLLAVSLVLAASSPSSHAGTPPILLSSSRGAVAEGCDDGPASCHGDVTSLYRYGYSLGVHPFTSPHDVRRQLTDHFWLFPVSGGCPARIRPGDTCELLGGNPIRVEAVGRTWLQIATLPGHDLGEGLHIRFAFTRSFGFHYLVVSAWQDRPTRCTQGVLCATASRAGAWVLWRVLSGTLTITAYAA